MKIKKAYPLENKKLKILPNERDMLMEQYTQKNDFCTESWDLMQTGIKNP